MKPTALIDGDIVAYQSAARGQKSGSWDDTSETPEPTFDPEDVEADVHRTIRKWVRKAGCGDYVVLLTGATNFRKSVDPTYKGNRVDKPKPVGLPFARSVLLEKHAAKLVDGLEADDLLGLMLTGSMAGGRGVCVSIDKDLRTVPGVHCNPTTGVVDEVDQLAADLKWMTQTLTGDPVDGYSGAPGIGPAKAAKMLAGKRSLEGLWAAVVKGFVGVKATQADALRNARMARILRTGDYSKETRTVRLWRPGGSDDLCLDTLTSSSRPTCGIASPT